MIRWGERLTKTSLCRLNYWLLYTLQKISLETIILLTHYYLLSLGTIILHFLLTHLFSLLRR